MISSIFFKMLQFTDVQVLVGPVSVHHHYRANTNSGFVDKQKKEVMVFDSNDGVAVFVTWMEKVISNCVRVPYLRFSRRISNSITKLSTMTQFR